MYEMFDTQLSIEIIEWESESKVSTCTSNYKKKTKIKIKIKKKKDGKFEMSVQLIAR